MEGKTLIFHWLQLHYPKYETKIQVHKPINTVYVYMYMANNTKVTLSHVDLNNVVK